MVSTNYPNMEIILADNASTDASVEWVTKTYPEVRIVRHPENWAFCKGNNEAILHATGDYVVLLNNDVEVPPDWLTPLVELAATDAHIAAIQPKLLQYGRRDWFEYAGAAGGFLDRFGYPFARGRIFFTVEPDEGQYNDVRDIFWASGTALFLRRSALDRVGLLDEQFFMHMEEIDLCWRLLRAGFRVMVQPESRVYHMGGGSLPQGNPRKTYLNYRNSLLMLYKNLPPSHWNALFRKRTILDGIAITRALLTGQLKEAQAIVRAYRDAHVMSGMYKNQRPGENDRVVQPSYRGNIVTDYFARGRKRFSDLPQELFDRTPAR